MGFILKWIFDRVVSLVGLLFLWPVLLIVAILVKVKMPGGPAFFVQKRVGKDGKLFDCHKFRTMTVKHNGSRQVQGLITPKCLSLPKECWECSSGSISRQSIMT